jgi:hypothetical protein
MSPSAHHLPVMSPSAHHLHQQSFEHTTGTAHHTFTTRLPNHGATVGPPAHHLETQNVMSPSAHHLPVMSPPSSNGSQQAETHIETYADYQLALQAQHIMAAHSIALAI